MAHAAAMSYTKIACGLIVFSFMTLTLTGLYTAQGDSKTPFIANLVGLATNMVLDPVLILGVGMFPKLGVVGAAIATVTAQAIVMSIMIVGIVIQKKENVLKGTRLLALQKYEFIRDDRPTALGIVGDGQRERPESGQLLARGRSGRPPRQTHDFCDNILSQIPSCGICGRNVSFCSIYVRIFAGICMNTDKIICWPVICLRHTFPQAACIAVS